MPRTFRRGSLFNPAYDYVGDKKVEAESVSEWTQQMHARTRFNSPSDQPVSGGVLLRSGVYMLLRFDKVVFIGKSKCLLATLAMHRAVSTGPRLPEWFPTKRIQFDDFQYISCAIDRATLLLPALIDLHQPVHNIHNRPAASLPIQYPIPDKAAPRITRRI